MTPISAAVGRVPPNLILVAGVVGYFAAATALLGATAGLAPAWAAIPTSSSCSLFACVGEALNNALGIPGFGLPVVAVVSTLASTVGGVFGGGSPPVPPGTTTYIPGVTADPTAGDVVYIPDLGVGTVTDAQSTQSRQPGGGVTQTSRVTVETESGTVTVEQNFTITPPTSTPGPTGQAGS